MIRDLRPCHYGITMENSTLLKRLTYRKYGELGTTPAAVLRSRKTVLADLVADKRSSMCLAIGANATRVSRRVEASPN